jgi:3-deoxy-manno-octulosonate cytidylyltransferase (CMP-KDO synthetase)
MKVLGIIPARYASTRFPGKPLIDIGGKTMIRRVYEQSLKAGVLNKVVVATDDERIFEHVISFSGAAVMTSTEHKSGTDRCYEAYENLKENFDLIINIQGDEPFIDPGQITALADCFHAANVNIATLIKKVETTEELMDPNIPKVVVNKNNQAILFSRATIPFFRGEIPDNWLKKHTYYKHIGIYAYRPKILSELVRLKQSPLEIVESLEQLRWIENGYNIHVALTTFQSVAIDTPEDLKKIKF